MAEGSDGVCSALCIYTYLQYFLISKSCTTMKASPSSSETIKRTQYLRKERAHYQSGVW